MKKIAFTIILLMVTSLCYADLYVVIEKETGEIKGVSSISDNGILGWTNKHLLKKVDESYRGKHGYEIKNDQGKLRHATQQEIASYKAEKEQVAQDAVLAKEKQKFLKWLDDEDVKNKVKNIKNL